MKLEDINIDDKVVYIPHHLLIGEKSEMVKTENLGIVISKNDIYVFVRFNEQDNSVTCKPDDIFPLKHRPDLQELIR